MPETATQPLPAAHAAGAPLAAWRTRLRATLPLLRHSGFLVVIGVSAALNTVRLSQNGYANIFYSAGVSSMLRSLHNFFFVAFDPGGLISVDKPPLALWLQAASAKLFGFSPLSLLLPEAIVGVMTVALLYVMLARRLGATAAFAGAFTLAVFPSFVAVSRDNGVDPLLVLLMLLACGSGMRASETGRWRALAASAVFVGLAFNTKTLAAYLVLPGIAAALLVCTPRPFSQRLLRVVVLLLVTGLASFAWILAVEGTPASERPFVGGSTDNTELGLTFGYNGFGRVEGQAGGPGDVHGRPGARVPGSQLLHSTRHRQRTRTSSAPGAAPAAARSPARGRRRRAARRRAAHAATGAGGLSTYLPNGRLRNPVPFGGPPSPVRLWGKGLGDQGGWLVPFALFGMVAVALLALRERTAAGRARAPAQEAAGHAAPAPGRSDPRLALLLVLGGWFFVEAVVLSASKGIVHPYYISALAPGTGAMAGAGATALVRMRRGAAPLSGSILLAFAILGTVAAQIVLLHREHYLLWLIPVLVGVGLLGLGLFAAVRALAAPALALAMCALAIAPTAYATTTWLAPVEGTFPAAGPKQATGDGGFGIGGLRLQITRAMLGYVRTHHPGSRWPLLTVASDTAAPFILMGLDAAAVGGYSGTDPALDGPALARLVGSGKARYVVLGGVYSSRGGNRATAAVLHGCRQLLPSTWNSPSPYAQGLVLFDCAGRERALARGG